MYKPREEDETADDSNNFPNCTVATDEKVLSSFDNGHDAGKREQWAKKADFMLACIGYAVGLGNVWRFPYLAYKSGGGAFLIPYFIMLIFVGIPLLYMELALGQYIRLGPVGAFKKIAPFLKGTGVATVVMTYLLCTYYNVIMAWALFYLVASFVSPLPYGTCGNWWNTDKCFSYEDLENLGENETQPNNSIPPTQEYFDHRVLQISSGLEDFGSMVWELFLFLSIAWILVYLCIWKGIKLSGKIVYFTATFPYFVFVVLLIYACTLPGAVDGIKYFLQPDWEMLLDPAVWTAAAAQNFNSIGIGFGTLIAMSSYNKFNNNIFADVMTVSLINAGTSLLAAFTIFAILGYMAYVAGPGVTVDDVVTDGPGLVFVSVPTAFPEMPAGNLWSFLFFFMLCCLALDSQFAMTEVVITTIMDAYPTLVKKYLRRKELLVLIVVVIAFCVGLPTIFEGGMYWFQIMDWYTAVIAVIIIATFEVIAISYIYGAGRLSRNVKEMMGELPNIFFRVCWWVISPILCGFIFISNCASYEVVTYGDYVYPDWVELFGWMVTSMSIVWIPLGMVHSLVVSKGNLKERFIDTLTPKVEETKQPEELDEKLDTANDNASFEDDDIKVTATRL
ncbi:neurotransmitter transporter-like protein [Saccoglossus kowalevskii]|uniref:Transporter n=1 Tax=Saccoglossus kowalevskii TaxID=10224 RepID=D1LX85_SACKO|nr:neurotransmitter transporter-like protein [Saccoglossus kowalevskii]ACY92591.1 neurotransmitter transporter-like protein [Saccoglossus kowalevskii]